MNKLKVKKTAVKWSFSLVRTAFLIGIIYIIMFPIIYGLSSSFMDDAQLTDPSVVWVPKYITLGNYSTVWEAMNYGSTFFFTVFLCAVSTLLQVFSCALCAYGLARFKFKGRNTLFFLVVITIILPPQMLVVQQYATFKNLGLLNTVFTYFLPAVLGQGVRAGLMIFIFRQFFLGLPKELEEAAYIDGCGTFKTFWRIVVPSAAVSFLVVVVFSLVWYWNETLLPSMFFDEVAPLSVKLSELKTNIAAHTVLASEIRNALMAASMLFVAPMVIVYSVLQKYFIQGIEHSGLVG